MKVTTSSGKRKMAVARATVQDGKGRVRVNRVPLEIHQPVLARLKMMEPLELAGTKVAKVDIDVLVDGGGVMGQAEATRTAIARGLVEFFEDDDLKAKFRAFDRSLIVSDPRRKEPKHQLGRGARKRRQKSYR